nr:TIGR04255 family protein [Rhodoferax sp.]
MGKKLTNAPVYYTVAQVRFNPVLDLDGYIPAIQSKMREAHFTDYKKEVFQQLVLPFGGGEQGQMAAPTITPQSRYQFGDIGGRSLFLLEANALSFQTTNYDTFETFSEILLKGLGMLHDALRLDFIERIGLRYLDAVQPSKAGETLREFLVPEVLGLALRGEGQLQHSVSETIVLTAAGQLVSRVLIRHGQVGLPMELGGFAPTIDPRFTQSESLHAIVDTDASIGQREVFDLTKVREQMTALHSEIAKSFNATVTDHARASWA